MSRHPNEPRFKSQLARAGEYAEDHPYWKGQLDALRLVAVDLGYSHQEMDRWLKTRTTETWTCSGCGESWPNEFECPSCGLA